MYFHTCSCIILDNRDIIIADRNSGDYLSEVFKGREGMVKNYVLCMACFCSEDSRGDDCRAKFSLVYEIRASEARR